LLSISNVRGFLYDVVVAKILNVFNVGSSSTSGGGTERMGILLYALENKFGYKMGKGIGYYYFWGSTRKNNSYNVGFVHFGISSLSSFVYLMGIWFYAFYLVWFTKMFNLYEKNSDQLFFIIELLLNIFLTFYTTNLTLFSVIACNGLLFAVFSMMKNKTVDALDRNNKI